MTDKMREEFEREWGQVDAEQGVHFIPELNTYGSNLYAQYGYAQMKSSAWFYFQKGWQSSHAALLKKQVKEQEEFLDHLADFEHEDTFHG